MSQYSNYELALRAMDDSDEALQTGNATNDPAAAAMIYQIAAIHTARAQVFATLHLAEATGGR